MSVYWKWQSNAFENSTMEKFDKNWSMHYWFSCQKRDAGQSYTDFLLKNYSFVGEQDVEDFFVINQMASLDDVSTCMK